MPLHAAIDVGSHATKLLLASERPDGRWRRRLERVVITGLGRGRPERDGLDADAAHRTLLALADLAALARAWRAASVTAVGTAVLRRARDADTFVSRVRAETGLALTVISGEQEARLTHLGAVANLPDLDGPLVTCDIGGRSTELTWGRGAAPSGLASLDLGTMSLAEAHGLGAVTDAHHLAAARAAARAALAAVLGRVGAARLVAIGATPGSLVAIDRGRDVADSLAVHGADLDAATVGALVARLAGLDTGQRRALPGLHPDRAPVILAGAVILEALLAWRPEPPLVVSATGLREGLLIARDGATGP
jgi:exopolyphosphatase/guanosine-5'-triphosphate,3'-diphosphate pyrophosphatase